MKKVKCGKCQQVLGVPTKFFGKKVSCPNCATLLRISLDSVDDSDDPDLSPALTLPDSGTNDVKSGPLVMRGIPPVPNPNLKRVAVAEGQATVVPPSETAQKSKPDSVVNPEDAIPGTESNSEPVQDKPARTVAKIVKVSEVGPELDPEGELPSLQLKETAKPKLDPNQKKTGPLFVAILMCSSLVLSGLILVFGDMSPKVDERAMTKARKELERFYSVRIDVPLKPYQIHLREAQLAHSRGDHESEVESYRKVLEMFRVEDRNRFVGVTGSPTADSELEHLVSVMLGNGRESSTSVKR